MNDTYEHKYYHSQGDICPKHVYKELNNIHKHLLDLNEVFEETIP